MVKDQQILEIDKKGTVYWSSNQETKPPTDEVPHKGKLIPQLRAS